MNYLFRDIKDLDAAKEAYDALGFCVFTNLLSDIEVKALTAGVDEAFKAGRFAVAAEDYTANDDAIDAHAIEQTCKHPKLVEIARTLMNEVPVELQHAKLTAKPVTASEKSEVRWHQDFPYFPHTNFDLLACGIHLDEEDEGSGSLEYVPGTHLEGEKNHLNEKGEFAYYCTEPVTMPSVRIMAKPGWVFFHHCLTLHRSAAKTNTKSRRIMVFQYRAADAVQLAGAVWKCNGYKVDPTEPEVQMARFPDGTSINVRGKGGRLFDLYNKLAPNQPMKQYG